MIKINLILEEVKRKQQFNRYILLLLAAALGIFLLIVVISSTLAVRLKIHSERHQRLSKKWEIIKEEEKEVFGLEGFKKKLNAKKQAIENLDHSRLPWSRKFCQLSRLVLPSIWLTDLGVISRMEKVKIEVKPTGQKENIAPTISWVQKAFQTIILKGVVISLAGEEMIDSIGKFMTCLENDQDFFTDFSDIALIFTRKKTILEREVMVFELACRLK